MPGTRLASISRENTETDWVCSSSHTDTPKREISEPRRQNVSTPISVQIERDECGGAGTSSSKQLHLTWYRSSGVERPDRIELPCDQSGAGDPESGVAARRARRTVRSRRVRDLRRQDRERTRLRDRRRRRGRRRAPRAGRDARRALVRRGSSPRTSSWWRRRIRRATRGSTSGSAPRSAICSWRKARSSTTRSCSRSSARGRSPAGCGGSRAAPAPSAASRCSTRSRPMTSSPSCRRRSSTGPSTSRCTSCSRRRSITRPTRSRSRSAIAG